VQFEAEFWLAAALTAVGAVVGIDVGTDVEAAVGTVAAGEASRLTFWSTGTAGLAGIVTAAA